MFPFRKCLINLLIDIGTFKHVLKTIKKKTELIGKIEVLGIDLQEQLWSQNEISQLFSYFLHSVWQEQGC